jgi:hypothetical protein
MRAGDQEQEQEREQEQDRTVAHVNHGVGQGMIDDNWQRVGRSGQDVSENHGPCVAAWLVWTGSPMFSGRFLLWLLLLTWSRGETGAMGCTLTKEY